MFTEWDVVPLVPVTVIVWAPVAARRLTVSVMVEEPVPVIEVGLKAAVTRLGRPLADSETGELNPPDTVEVMVTCPDELRETVRDVGLALMEKPALGLVTVSVTVVVWV